MKYLWEVTKPDRELAEKYVRENHAKNGLKWRGKFDGSLRQKFVGKLGEVIFGRYMNLPLFAPTGYDGGIDFILNGIKIDVKTAAVKSEVVNSNFLHPVCAEQGEKPDVYVFLAYCKEKQTITACGSIRANAIDPAWLKRKGEPMEYANKNFPVDTHRVPTTHLTDLKVMAEYCIAQWKQM